MPMPTVPTRLALLPVVVAMDMQEMAVHVTVSTSIFRQHAITVKDKLHFAKAVVGLSHHLLLVSL